MEVYSSKSNRNSNTNSLSSKVENGNVATKTDAAVLPQPAEVDSTKVEATEVVPVAGSGEHEQEFGVHAFQSVGAYQMMVREVEDIETFVPAHEIKSEYKKWEEGEVSKGMFLGFCNTPGRNGNLIPSVRWMTVGGKVFHHSGEILVSDAKNFNLQEGTPIQITYLGYKETKSKNRAMNFSVLILRRPNEKR